jgi:hypothetical protein
MIESSSKWVWKRSGEEIDVEMDEGKGESGEGG